MLVNNNTKFNAENIVKILNDTDVKQIEKSYANIFDTEATKKSMQQMTLDIVKYLAENQLRQEFTKSKFGKYHADRVKLIEKTLDKMRVSSYYTVFKRVYINDTGDAFVSNQHWLIKTTSKELEGIAGRFIITDKDKDKYNIPGYMRVIPKSEMLDVKKIITAKEIKEFIKLHGKDFTQKPFTIIVNEGTEKEFKYYLNQEYIEFIFKFYGTEQLNFFMRSEFYPSMVISPADTWNADDELTVITVLNPKSIKGGENK